MDYVTIWAVVLVFAVFTYVVLDGFDLGIGILYPFFREKRDRDLMMNSVAPVWDGNETWLVLGGGGLMAAFPMAYAILLPALYPVIIAMLLALILRGVAFEFRWKSRARDNRNLWDLAFTGGSTLAAFSQGVALGALLQGVAVEDRAYAGGWLDWLTPFSLLCGAAVVVGYGFLGACWLVMKLDGPVQDRMKRVALRTGFVLMGFIVVVSLATPFLTEAYFARWFAWPGIALTAPVPLAVFGLALVIMAHLRPDHQSPRDWVPFVASLAVFALCFVGLGVSMWPDIIPPSVTLADAAAPEASLKFMLVGAAVLLPVILAYTGYAYWVFRGKLDPEKGYH